VNEILWGFGHAGFFLHFVMAAVTNVGIARFHPLFNRSLLKLMTKLPGILLVLLICVSGIGFYRGWFSVSTHNGEEDGQKPEVSLSVDSDKAKEDVETVKDKAVELTEDAQAGVHRLGDQAKETLKKD